eukprot:CAMPEP_0177545476 /NCGR_PEP_ID=MMETSP0369-20130122/62632_1 /TAXON_ID=447022 ORGANISM="Scrippsiella hangoei-like, Strain SHHI-4" /NCGR_SAMPLE_ID=MMETSP0369 /ASSEMBLY_ACC=CAM_ASM_000364 /LENGTH=158 /DNA_ID=CAMNT_0019029759 /DNA_START=76 /DNA_END=552 /DNA_ORIENTATION=+
MQGVSSRHADEVHLPMKRPLRNTSPQQLQSSSESGLRWISTVVDQLLPHASSKKNISPRPTQLSCNMYKEMKEAPQDVSTRVCRTNRAFPGNWFVPMMPPKALSSLEEATQTGLCWKSWDMNLCTILSRSSGGQTVEQKKILLQCDKVLSELSTSPCT